MHTTVEGIHNSWWYMHRVYGSSAKLVHGDLYQLPQDLGDFDVAVFGAILLHLREPWGAIREVAKRTKERIVVTDLIQDREATLESDIMQFSPLAPQGISKWSAENLQLLCVTHHRAHPGPSPRAPDGGAGGGDADVHGGGRTRLTGRRQLLG
jgi:hypothetical protein